MTFHTAVSHTTESTAAPIQTPQNMLTPKTEAWIRDRLFGGSQWTPKQKDEFIATLNRALQEHKPETLQTISTGGSHRAYLMLNSTYMLLTTGKPIDYEGRYYMTASKIDRFWKEYMPKIKITPLPVNEVETGRQPAPTPAPAERNVQVNFVERTEKPEKYYITIQAGGDTYRIEFANPAKLPAGTELPAGLSGYSITALALNYGGPNAKVTKMGADGTYTIYDMGNIQQAQALANATQNIPKTVAVEAGPASREMLATSRFEITTQNGTFVVETPRLNKREYANIKTAFEARQSPEEALRLLLSTAGTRVQTTEGAELVREEALRMVREERVAITVAVNKPKEATG